MLPRIVVRITEEPRKKAPVIKRRQSVSKESSGGDSSIKRTPRWFLGLFFSVYFLAILWSSLVYSAEPSDTGTTGMASASGPQASIVLGGRGGRQRLTVPAYVHSAARAAGVDPRVARWIVSHESQYHPRALGDGGDSRGIWQINRVWHPEVTDQCAYDVRCSTKWALQRIVDGNAHEWTTWKYCRERFEDCPF